MNAPLATADRIAAALAPLGAMPLDEASVRAHVAPLFSRAIGEARSRVHLANHSLGRPLDVMEDDVREALAAWYARAGGAWAAWQVEMDAYRARLAELLNVSPAHAVVPKTSAGQGLRAVLNRGDQPWTPRVVATEDEFDSLDVILREYAYRGRIGLELVAARDDGCFDAADLHSAIARGADLVVLSPVVFNSGQVLPALPELIAHAQRTGALVLLDVYHALGAIPIDLGALDADFAVGGSYKYLRGGPGACFLYVHPRHLEGAFRTLDVGWFGKESPGDYARPEPPRFAAGGDGWLESTPAVLPIYQARSGQVFTKLIGVDRLRAWTRELQRHLVERLGDAGITARGGTDAQGAFVTVRDPNARMFAAALAERGIVADARGAWLRLGPDLLTTRAELDTVAWTLGAIARGQ